MSKKFLVPRASVLPKVTFEGRMNREQRLIHELAKLEKPVDTPIRCILIDLARVTVADGEKPGFQFKSYYLNEFSIGWPNFYLRNLQIFYMFPSKI